MRWYLGAALLLVIALFLESGLLAYAMYVLLGILVLSRLLTRAGVGSLEAARECNRLSAEVGESVVVNLTVRNTGRLPVLWVLLEDMLPKQALAQKPPRLKIKGKRVAIRLLRAGKQTTLRYTIECAQRGYYQLGPLVMESGDIFGLHRRYRVAAEPHYLLVFPRVVPLLGYDVASRRPIGEIRLAHRLYEDPTRISGVRAYEAGDPLNRIHWRATARTGALHSKMYEPSTLAGATIVLDFHRAGYHPRGEPHRSELAVTAAVSLAHAVYQMGQQTGLVSNATDAADRIRLHGWEGDYRTRQAARQKAAETSGSERLQPIMVETRRGPEQLQRIREALARAELSDGLSFAGLIVETASRLPRDATVLAVLADVPVETALALGTLRRHGFAVTVVLIMMDVRDLERGYGRLVAEGIRDVRHLRDEAGLPSLCQQQLLGVGAVGGWSPFEDVKTATEDGPGWSEQSPYEWESTED
jgi:uncharacterized protein (DUF58 family)